MQLRSPAPCDNRRFSAYDNGGKRSRACPNNEENTMKRLLLASAITACSLSYAHADTVFGIYAGAYSWKADYSGDINDTDAGQKIDLEDDLGFSDESNNVFYVAIEHPVPLLPNVRLQHTALDSSARGRLTHDFTFDDVDFNVNEGVATDIDFTHTDLTLYYELLDNWVNLDIGLTVRKFDGEIAISGLNKSARVDLDAALPMVYIAAQFDLPFTGLSAGVGGNAIGYSGNTLLDLNAYVQYEFPFGLGVRGGYRTFTLELDDVDDIDSDLTLDGLYGAIVFHF
jgi:outer membrane protein